ncbi:MAG: DUF3754 domain-containing protein [Gemmataceae bacterium]
MTAPDDIPEPYIPLRVADLINLLVREAGTPDYSPCTREEEEAFREFARTMSARMHAGFRGLLGQLKDAYFPFDPDTDTHKLREWTEEEERGCLNELFKRFAELLDAAGFHRMTRAEIEETMQGASAWGIEMDVSWDVFERVEVFYRGKGTGYRTRRLWRKWFQREEVALPTFRRVVIVLKQKPHRRLEDNADTDSVFLKLFKDIPQLDIEMLLPGTRLRMPKFERGKLGGTALSSVFYVLYKLSGISLTGLFSGSLLALYTPLMLIGGYAYKTFYSYQVSRRTYLFQLTQHLYFQNLDTNAGVLYRLFDDAEEQELRQALLAYFFLWKFHGSAGAELEQLDTFIEQDIQRRIGERIEVDTQAAIRRLERYKLVHAVGSRFVAVPVRQATALLEFQQRTIPPADRPSHWSGSHVVLAAEERP